MLVELTNCHVRLMVAPAVPSNVSRLKPASVTAAPVVQVPLMVIVLLALRSVICVSAVLMDWRPQRSPP